MKKSVASLLIYLLFVCSEARRIPRGLAYDLFPNFRTVYHGHGATSYQNVDIESHGSVPIAVQKHTHTEEHLTNYDDQDHNHLLHHHTHPISIIEAEPHVIEHYIGSTSAPYYDEHVVQLLVEHEPEDPHHYQHYDHVNYEYD